MLQSQEKFVAKSFAFRVEQKGDLFEEPGYLYAAKPDTLVREQRRLNKDKAPVKPRPVMVTLSFQQKLVKLGAIIRTHCPHEMDFAK